MSVALLDGSNNTDPRTPIGGPTREVARQAAERTDAVRPAVRAAVREALDAEQGAVLVRAAQGLGKSRAAIDAVADRARRGLGAVVVLPTRRLAVASFRQLRAALEGSGITVGLLVGRRDEGGALGLRGDSITSCTEAGACRAADLGLRAPGACPACPDRTTCAATPGGLLHGLSNRGARVLVASQSMLRALLRDGQPVGWRGRALVLDDCPPVATTVSQDAVRLALARVENAGLAAWLRLLDATLDTMAGALDPAADYGVPVALPSSLALAAIPLVEPAEDEHEAGRLPANVCELVARASVARVLVRRDGDTLAVDLSLRPAPLPWTGPVVALDATGRLADYADAWPGQPWRPAEIGVVVDPQRISTVVRRSSTWRAGRLRDLQAAQSPAEVEARILEDAARDLDLIEIQARAVAEARRALGLACRARVLLPRKHLEAAPTLAETLIARIESWGFATVAVDYWRGTGSRGVNDHAGTALTVALGAPRAPSSAFLPPPVARPTDAALFTAFWSRADAPRAWRDPGEPEALARMVAESAETIDQEVRRDRAEVLSDGGPILRYLHLPVSFAVLREAPPAWAAGEGYPALLPEPGATLPATGPTKPARHMERPEVAEGRGVVVLPVGSPGPAPARLRAVLAAVRERGWLVVTRARLESELGMAPATAGRVVDSLGAVGLGVVEVHQPKGRPARGVIVALCSFDEALADARRAHPDAYVLWADLALSSCRTLFSHSALEEFRGAGERNPAAVQHAHEGLDGAPVSWTELPLKIGHRGAIDCTLDAAERSDTKRCAWARTRRRGLVGLDSGDDVPLGKVYRSADGRLRDRKARATATGKLGERAHLRAQPGHVLLDVDLRSAHLAAAWRWAGQPGDPTAACAELQGALRIDRDAAKVALLAWINGARNGGLAEITGNPDTLTTCERAWPCVADLLARLRAWWKACPEGSTMDTHGLGPVPESWHMRLERPPTWRTLASRLWTRPEALWLDLALATATRGAVESAVAVPLYDGALLQLPASPWLPWRVSWLVGALDAQAAAVGLGTRIKAAYLGAAWGGAGSPPTYPR
ncbi:MAG: DEAD/DEAH box helicase [Pseudomonadota bacterium]